MKTLWLSLVAASCIAATSGVAQAVNDPNGNPIPRLGPATACGTTTDQWGNVQPCLDNNEISLGGMAGAIRAQQDATIDEEIFEPQCQLKFKVIQRGGDYASVFGWYPATEPPTAPALKDMHVMLTCKDMEDPLKPGVDITDPIGTEKVLTVPPGTGKVGFFMSNNLFDCKGMIAPDGATPPGEVLAMLGRNTAYTQQALNKGPGGNYMVLQWQSKANADAFYFGWEDNYEGTDGDYEDLLTMVTGVDCAEGGATCETTELGICKPGTMQCRNGGLECVRDNDPTAEKCNNIDDNCDDVIDDGDGLCKPREVCLNGVCVGDCGSLEFPCPSGFTCVDPGDGKRHCVETACVDVVCPVAGERCVGGNCIGDCKGVICPWGQNCQSGKCVPACENLSCDPGFVCVVLQDQTVAKGICQTCPCKGCPDGTVCDAGYCRPQDCVGVTCQTGTHCVGGTCVDDCAGTVCPFGGTCTNGTCTGGGGIGGSGTGGTGGNGTGGIIITGGTNGTGATGATGGSGNDTGSGGDAGTDNDANGRRGGTTGCACRTPNDLGSSPYELFGFIGSLLGLAGWRRRRSN